MPLENLSLSKKNQPSFDVTVKHIKKKLRVENDEDLPASKGRGVVKLHSIPHGFFEDELKQYFKQFGTVTRARVARSRKTGNSKGFAYVEFLVPEVAKVAAETMNNYLMFDKLLKATYIPPEEQKYDYLYGTKLDKVPGVKNRRKAILEHNKIIPKSKRKDFYKGLGKQLKKTLNKLKELGVEYDFKPAHTYIHTSTEEVPVFVVDESDKEITLKIPKNVKVVKKEITKKKSFLSPGNVKEVKSKSIISSLDNSPLRNEMNNHPKVRSLKTRRNGDSVMKSKEYSKKTMKKDSFNSSLMLVNHKSTNKNCKINPENNKSVKSLSSTWDVKELT